jgi:outer membrane lipoprotein-sorting protein
MNKVRFWTFRLALLAALPFGTVTALAEPAALADSARVADSAGLADSADQGAQSLDGLLAAFRKSPGVSARFVEEKHIALLKKPLKSEGSIYFLAPGKLARIVDSPKPSKILLEGDELRISDGKGVRLVDLSKNAAVAALVRSFVNLLHGDRAALEKDFSVKLTSSSGGGFSLRLVPKAAPLNQLVTSIEVVGKGLVLSEMTVSEASGDQTITRFSDVNTDRRYSEDEKKTLFSF